MQLADILRPEAVKVIGQIASKKRLLQELCDLAAASGGFDPAAAFDALLERESLGPTGVGRGVALPHARIQGLDKVVGAFIRVEKPLDFSSMDRQPVDLAFALFAPAESGVEHLKALALVSRTLRDQQVCAKLRGNDDPQTLYAILTSHVATRAA